GTDAQGQVVGALPRLEGHTLGEFGQERGIDGIAAASAIQLLGELLVLPPDMKAKQWVALAGLDPQVHDSGSSVHKKPRLS
ncbi:MAG: hypothetical protein, partial [Olavius algarvensis Gamma 1 endosymbiont]